MAPWLFQGLPVKPLVVIILRAPRNKVMLKKKKGDTIENTLGVFCVFLMFEGEFSIIFHGSGCGCLESYRAFIPSRKPNQDSMGSHSGKM